MADRSDETRLRAEARFRKKELQAKEEKKVWAEREAASRTAYAKTLRLVALRLAKEADETAAAARPKDERKDSKKPT